MFFCEVRDRKGFHALWFLWEKDFSSAWSIGQSARTKLKQHTARQVRDTRTKHRPMTLGLQSALGLGLPSVNWASTCGKLYFLISGSTCASRIFCFFVSSSEVIYSPTLLNLDFLTSFPIRVWCRWYHRTSEVRAYKTIWLPSGSLLRGHELWLPGPSDKKSSSPESTRKGKPHGETAWRESYLNFPR